MNFSMNYAIPKDIKQLDLSQHRSNDSNNWNTWVYIFLKTNIQENGGNGYWSTTDCLCRIQDIRI